VEGFIAALRNPYTRVIKFQWGKFVFEGILNNISAEYTMFSNSGRPVRAKLRVKLTDLKNKSANNKWGEYLNTAFPK
jgi:hypothetical protein